MRIWLRRTIIIGLSALLLLALPALTLAAGLQDWQSWELTLLGIGSLLGGIGLGMALLRIRRAAEEEQHKTLRQQERELENSRVQIKQLTQTLRQNVAQLVTERDRAELLSQSLADLTGSAEPKQSLDTILRRAIRAARARWGSILLIDEQGQLSEAVLSRSARREEKPARTGKILSQGLAGWVVQNRQGSIIRDTTQDSRWLTFPEDESPAKSAVAVPFLPRERVLGVMVLSHPEPGRFNEADLDLLQQLGQQAAICLENAELYILAASERSKLAAILEGTTDAVLVTDQEGKILLVNPAAAQLLQLQGRDLRGRPLSTAIPQPDLVALFAGAVERGVGTTEELTMADQRTFHGNVFPIPAVGWVMMLHDITYLKQLDEMKDEFVATVSHDLRSPLTKIQAFADLIRMEGTLSERQEEAIERIGVSVSEMSDLISDLLDLAKIEAGVDMELGPCQLAAVVTETADSFAPRASQKGLQLRTSIRGEIPEVVGNDRRLRQVIANLIDNAIKYTPSGGKIQVHVLQHDGELVITVADTGYGIPATDQPHLFEKFYRIHTPQAPEVPGTGLGLAIAHSIVERHGGRMWVQSAPGRGSTFAFALPIPEDSAPIAEPKPSPDRPLQQPTSLRSTQPS